MSGIFVDRQFYSGSPPQEPISSHLIPCSGTFEPDSAGNSVITVSAKYYEELHKKAEIDYTPRKIYGEEDKMKLVDDQSFWRKWWNKSAKQYTDPDHQVSHCPSDRGFK